MKPAQLRQLLRRGMVRAFGGTLGLQVALLGINFLSALVLTNLLGARGFGLYTMVTAWANVLTIPGKLGANFSAVRHCAVYIDRQDGARLDGFLHWLRRTVLAASLSVAALAALVLLGYDHWRGGMDPSVWALVPLVPLLSFIQANFGAFRGMKSVYQAQLAEVLRQGLFLAVISSALFAGHRITLPQVMAAAIGAAGVGLLVGSLLLRRRRRSVAPPSAGRLDDQRPVWWRDARALTLSSSVTVVNQRLDVLLLGVLAGPTATGIYAVGKKAVELMRLLPMSANMVVGPHFAAQHARGDHLGIARTAVRASRWMTAATVAAGLVLLLAGEWLLGLFGREFGEAYWVMAILVCAQVVNVMYGMVSMILSMSGNAHLQARGIAVAIACQVVLAVLLVPPLGAVGAAISAGVGVAAWNLLLARYVRRELGVGVSIWSRLPPAREA